MVVFTFFLISCENDIEEVNTITAFENLPAESTRDVELLYSDSGMVQVKLTAPKLDRYLSENPYIEMPEGIHVTFYDKEMNVESELTANYAIRYENERKMEAMDDVILINHKGERLNTEHLIWDEEQEKIYSTKFVRITTPDEVITGENGFEADQHFSHYTIYKAGGDLNIKDE